MGYVEAAPQDVAFELTGSRAVSEDTMLYSSFRSAIPFMLAVVLLQVMPGCGANVEEGSGGSGGTGNGTASAAGTTSGGSGTSTGSGGLPDGGLSCEERAMAARQAVVAVAQAHASCATDADCTSVDISTDCGGDCPYPVNWGGGAAVQAAVADVNAGVCKGYQDDGCPYASPSCAYPPADPVCDGSTGTCQLWI
jgi:hypothetical protein